MTAFIIIPNPPNNDLSVKPLSSVVFDNPVNYCFLY